MARAAPAEAAVPRDSDPYDFVKERSGHRLGEALDPIASSADTESGPPGEFTDFRVVC